MSTAESRRGIRLDGRDDTVVPADLRTRDCHGQLAIGTAAPRLAWRLCATREGVRQRGYEVEVAGEPGFRSPVTSGFVETSLPFDAPWPAPALQSREVAWARVRVWTDLGRTGWSDPLRLEAGLLRPDDWRAHSVSPLGNVGRSEPLAVPLLRRSFELPPGLVRARLYVTALGIHRTTINGADVTSDLFDPGWSAYAGRHLYAAYDVTDLLRPGENVLAAAVGDGWWRGQLTWMSLRAVYGDTTALLAQLELEFADGARMTVATNEAWRGATGGWLAADIYDGSTLDLRREPQGWRDPGFDDSAWKKAVVVGRPENLEPRPMSAVRIVETRKINGRKTERNSTLYDCGQNLTGWLRLQARGPAGARIAVRHAEVLADDGRLHTAALRNARATDTYVLDEAGTFVLEPLFTFHGFRFAEVVADPGVVIDGAEARVVTSDSHASGEFECSDPLVNKLWQNVGWSQRGNFLALPTDCPQRDERMGWTGDIQVFAPTACLNSDVNAFLASWLSDLGVEQRADGCVPAVVPNCIADHPFAFGAAGWGDAATLVPWALYEAYGDVQVLRDQFQSMKAWVDWCASRLRDDGVWVGDFQFGDWLDPNAPPDNPLQATTPSGYVASSYLSRSASVLAAAAQVLGQQDSHDVYEALSRTVAAATWLKWGEIARTTQAGCAIAVEFGIAPEDEHPQLGAQLAALVDKSAGRIGTGFLGTPLVLPALARTGQIEAAYKLLLNRQAPGWLYQVLHGATTTWERWDAIRQDGSIHPGEMSVGEGNSMMSFNHYAYGAVAAWLYHSVAGIAPAEPGYSLIRFAPEPGGTLRQARAQLETPFGRAAVEWRIGESGRLQVKLVIPAGSRGIFVAPASWRCSSAGADGLPLVSGVHEFSLETNQG